jgi:predicted alpha/beta hydrolase family esterase
VKTATSFLILHGIENHRPPGHWQFLLAAQLVERGHDVRYPALPEPDAPGLERWLSMLQLELAALGGQQRVVVCHSLACLLWFHAAARGVGDPVARLLLVAPPASERVPESGASFRLSSFDSEAVRSSVTGEIAIACSDADPYNPSGAQSLYGDPLGVTATIVEGAAHITPDTGYGAWPYAAAWCLADRHSVSHGARLGR